jgi:hypothetical protein
MKHIKYTTIVTHTDFDGIVSALLLSEVYDIDHVVFREPADIQKGIFKPSKYDIVCDLPKSGGLWYDHHPGQETDNHRVCHYCSTMPSAARVIFERHKDQLSGYEELVKETDRIDTADYTREEYLNPNACQKISITLRSKDKERDDNYRLYILNELSYLPPNTIVEKQIVLNRYLNKLDEWQKGEKTLEKNLVVIGNIAIVDFVAFGKDAPTWRVHKLYLDHPQALFVISASRYLDNGDVKISCMTNIFAPKELFSNVHIGQIMNELGGGGHKGVGGCNVLAKDYLNIIENIRGKLNAIRIN